MNRQPSVAVEFKVDFGRGRQGQRTIKPRVGGKRPPIVAGRVPRVARLMALAIHCEQMLKAGEVKDYADLARLAHVTRARMTQIMNLTLLAPDLQERILMMTPVEAGRDALNERELRPIAAVVNWGKQRAMMATLK